MLTDQQESSLISGGDCHEHYHTVDRQPTHDFGLQLDALETSVLIGSGTYVVPNSINYVVVDTTLGNAMLTLPSPLRKGSITIIKSAAANSVIITPAVGLINGAASLTLSSAYDHAKFKAIQGNYYRV